ncbi:Dioxygenase cnsJ [Penicillium nucicola]|uniref:Dioxygenase cnsJ n=1 Tax=Penicillium nucicola TaxID=1850975 RepID=UPI002545044C|nr:Dioxygenase cnsJ [Penicillium nucicola]KAJ5766304.1 Dioxygenase cnsJ [Penicillium nucicola]
MTVTTKQDSKSEVTEIPEVFVGKQQIDDALAADVIKHMEVAGVCILRNIFDQSILDQILEDFEPHVPKTDSFIGYTANGCQMTGLVTKSETYAQKVIGNSIFEKVRNHFLTSRYGCWVQEGIQMEFENPPQLDSTVCFYLKPDSPDQLLHRDDQGHQNWNGAASEYVLGRDSGCAMFAALTDATKENGTTRFIPGSHLWDYNVPHPIGNDPRLRYAELKAGDCFMMLSSVIHASSANTTVDNRRVLLSTHVTRSHLRQEENPYLTYDIEKVRKLPVWLQKFLGYNLLTPLCGWVDKKDPLLILNPDASPDDLYNGYGREYLALRKEADEKAAITASA